MADPNKKLESVQIPIKYVDERHLDPDSKLNCEGKINEFFLYFQAKLTKEE